MKLAALDSLKSVAKGPAPRGVTPRIVKSLSNGKKRIMTAAACQMADLLERQSALLVELGMFQTAQQACLEVRQLRLLAALDD